jgi:hypothetical protein
MIARSAVVALAAAGSAIVLSAAPLQVPKADVAKSDTVGVGVACGADGTFIPLAARAEGRWAPLSTADERVSLHYFFGVLTRQALRMPRQGWTLYPRRAGAPQPLVLRSLRKDLVAESGDCFLMQAYDSNAPLLPGRVACVGCTQLLPQTGGIGVVGPARFDSGENVTAQPDESSARVAARVVRAVHAVERRLDREAGVDSPLRRFDGRKDVRSVVRLLTMVRHRTDAGELYFFQARKQYGEWYVFEGKRLYKDWARTLVHGWVRVSSAGVSMLPATGVFEDDDGKQGSIYHPAGFLVLDDRTVLIAAGFGYEYQFYELFEIGPRDTPPQSVLVLDVGGS